MALMFDWVALERQSGLRAMELEAPRREIREEVPQDDLLYELHLMRALNKMARDRSQSAGASPR